MSDFERVKSSIDLAAYVQSRGVSLKKAGRLHKACCPFHTEKTPSFVVDGDRWRCYGACATGGDIFDFVQAYDHVEKADALVTLADYAHIDLAPHQPKEDHTRLYALLEDTTRLYQEWLFSPVGESALKYLHDKRGLTDEIIHEFRLGYTGHSAWNTLCSGHLAHLGYTDDEMIAAGVARRNDEGRLNDFFRSRIMIPLMDGKGRVVGFSGRTMLSDQPKYINSAQSKIFNKGVLIFGGTSRVKKGQGTTQTPSKVSIVVEGQFDVMQARLKGFTNVYAQMGTSLSDDQLAQLAKGGTEKIIFCFDNDQAGEKAMRTLAEKHIHTAARLGVDLLIMRPPHGKDADDTFREKPDLWQVAVDAARPVVDVLIDLHLAALSPNASIIEKQRAAVKLLPSLKSENTLVTRDNLQKLALRLNVNEGDLEQWARSQVIVMPAQTPIKQTPNAVPTHEEWVLHGIILNDDQRWLDRANAALLIASADHLAYALAPLSVTDFTEAPLRNMMSLIDQGCKQGVRPVDTYLDIHVERSLEETYKRLASLDEIGRAFHIPFSYDTFIDSVLQIRINRLKQDRVSFEGKDAAKARECAMGIACLMLAQEEILDRIEG